MTQFFETVSIEQGWNDYTKTDMLLRFVSENGLSTKLNDFIGTIANDENDFINGKPPGFEAAKEALEYDDDNELTLFETEIGLFDLEEDPNTPFDTVMILGAHVNALDAWEQALLLAEVTIPTTGQVSFSVIAKPEEVELSDY